MSNRVDLLTAALAEIARLREERRWIPVGERLPEEGRLVLWYCPDERWPVTSGRFERPYHMNWGGDMSVPISEGGYTHWMPLPAPGYTHWMPLPAPPSEGEVE